MSYKAETRLFCHVLFPQPLMYAQKNPRFVDTLLPPADEDRYIHTLTLKTPEKILYENSVQIFPPTRFIPVFNYSPRQYRHKTEFIDTMDVKMEDAYPSSERVAGARPCVVSTRPPDRWMGGGRRRGPRGASRGHAGVTRSAAQWGGVDGRGSGGGTLMGAAPGGHCLEGRGPEGVLGVGGDAVGIPCTEKSFCETNGTW